MNSISLQKKSLNIVLEKKQLTKVTARRLGFGYHGINEVSL